jgi:hypothetical protein
MSNSVKAFFQKYTPIAFAYAIGGENSSLSF